MNVFSLSWAAAGLALLGLSLFPAGSVALGGAPAHLAVFLLLLALAGAWFLFPDAFSLERGMEGPARIGSLLFGFVIPVLLLLVKKLRRQV